QTISFRTESEAWCPMGYFSYFFMTFDAGLSWNQIDTPDSAQIFDLVFINNKFGIGVGLNGRVVKFNYESVNINNNTSTPYIYNLYQNYPNPFNPNTNIEYKISEISKIELKVYNLLGQEVETMFKGIKNAGKYTIRFFGSNLPSGIYFYRLSTKNLKTGVTNFETKKMILLK
ncbi:MAG: T9SS type A sorting domain-containing protein, partial [Ignavibacteriae bacterium]|nr:T9SS type A sorting domain-containing protein [Ignavibacteriota bacterium]